MAANRDPFLRFHQVHKSFGDTAAVAGITLDIAQGSFVALVGASGSGKSTLLKTINRLIDPTRGRIMLDGQDIDGLKAPALRRRIGYVFQQVGLFPHMDVAGNIGIGPRIAGSPLTAERITQLLDLVELERDFAGRMPDQLSGGQRQRVGLARALAIDPQILLMDEPFGALDPVTRDALGAKVCKLHADLGLTTIMVTHDMAEALLLADRVLVMDAGCIIADALPQDLLAGSGGEVAQALVDVPRQHARRLAELEK